MDILWFILIGLVAGWLAGLIVKGRGLGLIGDLVVGVIGALIGGFLARQLNISEGGLLMHLLVATGGAVLLLFVIKLIRRA